MSDRCANGGAPQPDFEPGCRQVAHELAGRLTSSVTQRFEKLTGVTGVVVPATPSFDQPETTASLVLHPNCRRRADHQQCQSRWREVLTRVRTHHEQVEQECRFGNYCRVIPVLHKGECVAVYKLVTDVNSNRADFDRATEVLHLLLDSFRTAEKSLLDRVVHDCYHAGKSGSDGVMAVVLKKQDRVVWPEAVRRAVGHVERHFADPKLNVDGVADALQMNSSYLAHLVSRTTGVRMSQLIAHLRIEKAKTLLVTTDWQIKRVALASGYANRAWFSEVFRNQVGESPGYYRLQHRSK